MVSVERIVSADSEVRVIPERREKFHTRQSEEPVSNQPYILAGVTITLQASLEVRRSCMDGVAGLRMCFN